MTRKIILSFISGLVILFGTWIYQNSSFSRGIEDGFFKKVSLLWKFKLFSKPRNTAEFVFINTGKDLALVEDTVEYGNITVSNRKLIHQLAKLINETPQKPLFTVLDIQFYYPFSIAPEVDQQLQQELEKNDRLIIPVVRNSDGSYKEPLFKINRGYSDYRTYSAGFNKFKLLNKTDKSIPVYMHETLNNARYNVSNLFSTCNNRICLTAIWPGYYLNNDEIMYMSNDTQIDQTITKHDVRSSKRKIQTEYYNLGEILLDLDGNPDHASKFFENKILFIGNFQDDIHTTPIGKMSGPVILANIYLSLLNNQHIVSIGFLIFLLIGFSAVSYIAWFDKMPRIKMNEDIFPSFLAKLVRKYMSYFGCMFLLSLISIFVFNVQVALFVPSLVFAEIESRHETKESFIKFLAYFRNKFLGMKKFFKSLHV